MPSPNRRPSQLSGRPGRFENAALSANADIISGPIINQLLRDPRVSEMPNETESIGTVPPNQDARGKEPRDVTMGDMGESLATKEQRADSYGISVAARKNEEEVEPLSSSVATLKPTTVPTTTTATQYLTIDTRTSVDPVPSMRWPSQPSSRSPSHTRLTYSARSTDPSPTRSDIGYDERRYVSEEEKESDSRSEIQSIMEQFPEDGGGPGAEEVMSPRLEMASPILGNPMQHPPRKSSLEPLASNLAQKLEDLQGLGPSVSSPSGVLCHHERDEYGAPVPSRQGFAGPSSPEPSRAMLDPPMSANSIHRPPPPEPEPESALPFDFHRFLEQLRHKRADPVARYLKSFLFEFGKRQWMVHEQVKIIGDFLVFISNKMAQCEVWKDATDAEFDNAREGMEKLVMNRLYTQTFSPAIPPPQPIPGARSKKRVGDQPLGPGRRGQHQEDIERDEVLAQKINIYSWISEEHLDIPAVSDSGKKFLDLAQKELQKINSYRAPRDKIICVLNCCKVIFGLLKHSKSDSSADSFMPMLIYVVLHANPEHMVSNVQYILRFRNQDKLGGEAGYYLSSLMGAIQFIENMDKTTLTITDAEFEANVEAAVSAIAERHRPESPPPVPHGSNSGRASSSTRPPTEADASPHEGRDNGEYSGTDEKAAISGLFRTIQKPLSTIGRMFSEDSAPLAGPSTASPARTPQPERSEADTKARQRLSAEEAAARQASAESAEAQRLSRAEHANVVETLAGMFPDLDRDIISDVVHQKQGRVGLAVDACLALSA